MGDDAMTDGQHVDEKPPNLVLFLSSLILDGYESLYALRSMLYTNTGSSGVVRVYEYILR